MFRHNKPPEKPEEEKNDEVKPEVEKIVEKPKEETLEDLVKKNLKWSQIIYEQNRKINNKLLWSAIAEWLRLLIIVIPIILALLYLPPLLKNIWSQYSDLLGNGATQNSGSNQNTIDNFIKLFNLDPAKQEQLKSLLK